MHQRGRPHRGWLVCLPAANIWCRVRASARVNLNRRDYARFASLEILSRRCCVGPGVAESGVDAVAERTIDRDGGRSLLLRWSAALYGNVGHIYHSGLTVQFSYLRCAGGGGWRRRPALPSPGLQKRQRHGQATPPSTRPTPSQTKQQSRNSCEAISWSAEFDATRYITRPSHSHTRVNSRHVTQPSRVIATLSSYVRPRTRLLEFSFFGVYPAIPKISPHRDLNLLSLAASDCLRKSRTKRSVSVLHYGFMVHKIIYKFHIKCALYYTLKRRVT